jgi:hypothetical protein
LHGQGNTRHLSSSQFVAPNPTGTTPTLVDNNHSGGGTNGSTPGQVPDEAAGIEVTGLARGTRDVDDDDSGPPTEGAYIFITLLLCPYASILYGRTQHDRRTAAGCIDITFE